MIRGMGRRSRLRCWLGVEVSRSLTLSLAGTELADERLGVQVSSAMAQIRSQLPRNRRVQVGRDRHAAGVWLPRQLAEVSVLPSLVLFVVLALVPAIPALLIPRRAATMVVLPPQMVMLVLFPPLMVTTALLSAAVAETALQRPLPGTMMALPFVVVEASRGLLLQAQAG